MMSLLIPPSRGAGAGGNDDVRRRKGLDLVNRHLVVAKHADLAFRVHLAQLLNQVVGEGIVIVDQYEHVVSLREPLYIP